GFADALTAGSLGAGGSTIPTMLVEQDAMPGPTASALAELDPDRVLVIGGTAAVDDAVLDGIAADGRDVERLSGASRYETSVVVAEQVLEDLGRPDALIFATGDAFPDSLVAG